MGFFSLNENKFDLESDSSRKIDRMGIFLDTETTGLDIHKHSMIEIALKVIDMLTGEEIGSYESVVAISDEEWEKSSKDALVVNGFTREEVCRGKSLKEISKKIISLFTDCGIDRYNSCYICQNPSFDRIFFTQLFSEDLQYQYGWPYHWLDLASMNWGLEMHRFARSSQNSFKPIGFSKDCIAEQHKLPKEKKPHRAMNGVDHLFTIYKEIVGFRGKVSLRKQ